MYSLGVLSVTLLRREMPKLHGVKKVFDEVHGYIELTEPELAIVDTPTFQRLRYIKQLAVAWYVYPGATHTRFSHSLGVMHVMGLIARRLYSMGYIHSEDDVQLLRLAALLHDVGHTPFSHAIEPYYRDRVGLSHEDLTEMMILESYDIRDTLIDYGFDPREIVMILKGKHKEPLYNQLISSDLDVDRMDYLLRDALHTGVAYGTIDIHRIIATITVDGEGNLALLERGLDALENFYLARLHMYKAVYYHKTIVGYELLLRRVYERLCEELTGEILFNSVNEITRAIRNGSIHMWNDAWLIGVMMRALERNDVSSYTKELISAFLTRRGYKVLIDRSHFSFSQESTIKDADVEELKRLAEELKVKANVDEVFVFVDDIKIVDTDPRSMPHIVVEGQGSRALSVISNSIINALPRRYHVKRLYVLSLWYERAKKYISKKGVSR